MIASAHVIGMGRLGRHLALRLEHLGITVYRWNRSSCPGARTMDQWDGAEPVDAVFLAVPDDALAELAVTVAPTLDAGTLLAHHAGSVPLDVLPVAHEDRAVLWPPMTFIADRTPDWEGLPMAVESGHPDWLEFARRLAPGSFPISAGDRQTLHLGAVLAGNLSAAWIGLVEQFLHTHSLPISSLKPLIEESVGNALKGSALKTLSGPATRGDRATLDQQVRTLARTLPIDRDLVLLHRILTDRILREHGHPPLPPIQTAPEGH